MGPSMVICGGSAVGPSPHGWPGSEGGHQWCELVSANIYHSSQHDGILRGLGRQGGAFRATQRTQQTLQGHFADCLGTLVWSLSTDPIHPMRLQSENRHRCASPIGSRRQGERQ
ncbi:hypothetical protein GGTG_03911 [Gaeumannomyces tritici R3-111a-1]|uniref:Uncharacterized protein n=1 Tax=Gaeumannomyces tritici (strain R3-111a-1) TaxID=644352 RepID=J3NRK8_GAET3|nr:hypothetical protein GGTG_03911 [Gaeumannomyces tritici R3-111a-1]EJT78814.1 hypothetical protein GGTG_03911 [Gaeumannomyces tritici R3-111a-1]